jgi:hypothetical protein
MLGKWTGVLVSAALFVLPSIASNAQSRIGQASSVRPQAEGSLAGTLEPGSDVHEGEMVRTGTLGQANLQFPDKSSLNVGPTSVIKLDKFVYDPNKRAPGTMAIEATRGAFRFVTGSENKNGEFKIKTPYGIIGVRG